ncbi:hypothetical protein [Actinoplanes sp. RD1]|uniref:hypothetical protein n=1 Tax=Actinoplanes sp. RD1 TaxID=3064538 RepID=UPI00274189CC|nr:hypothetical protein [Actinoplanes sp. RD1]
MNGWKGGGISAEAAVVERDGALLVASDAGLTRYHGTRDEQLARADWSTSGLEGQGSRSLVRGLAETGDGRIVVDAGLGTDAGPALALSTDRGRTVRTVRLPSDPARTEAERGSRQVVGAIAAHDRTIVAVGSVLRRATV